MRRREVQEQQSEERDELEDARCIQVPFPVVEFVAVPCSNRRNENSEVDSAIGDNDSDMSPLVGKKLRKCECRHLHGRSVQSLACGGHAGQANLTESTTETSEGHPGGNHVGVSRLLGSPRNQMTDDAELAVR